jgi:hypothetical protein
MSVAHLALLRAELERRHWQIVAENKATTDEDPAPLSWTIARANGDSPLTLEFTQGYTGRYLDIPLESIDDSIACRVVDHPEIPGLYFGKFHGQFQIDVVKFADAINAIG